jgi:hypothetical protein
MRAKISYSFIFFLDLYSIATSVWGTNTTLIRQSLYPGYFDKLTKSETNYYLGVDLFSYPYRGAESFKQKPNDNWWMIGFVVDSDWDRMVYGDYNDDWIKSFGTTGSGDGQFKCPRGIAADNLGNVYVADFLNGRVVKLHYDFNNEALSFVQNITGGGMVNPYDVATDDANTYDDPSDDAIWVVDFATHKLYHFSASGDYLSSYGGLGSGVGHFSYPSSIAARSSNWFDGTVYVVDTGNNRIVRLTRYGDSYVWKGSYEAPVGSYLTSVDVDRYGDVWVTDRYNCRIFKFTDYLTLLTTFGSQGTGLNQFLQPIDFSHARHYGDYLIIESWTDNSGVQYYVPGVDILNLEAWPNQDSTIAIFSFILTEWAEVKIQVYRGSNLIKTLYSDICFGAGDWTLTWDGTDANGQVVPQLTYTIKITAVASFTYHGNPTYTKTDSVDVVVGEKVFDVPGDFPTIQQAINAAAPYDWPVRVAPGTYHGGDGNYGTVVVKEGVHLEGTGVDSTIIDGGGTGNVIEMGANSSIKGFTITHSGEDWPSAGVKCTGQSVKYVSIIGNEIYANCIGIDCYDGVAGITIACNRIAWNSSDGVSFCILGSVPDWETSCYNNVITDNDDEGIDCKYSSPLIFNNTIYGNGRSPYPPDSASSGIECGNYSSPLIENNIIVYTHHGYGINSFYFSYPLIQFNDVWQNSYGSYHNCSADTGDISADPLFEDEPPYFHLLGGSPCIDKGNPESGQDPYFPSEDFDGNSRVEDGDNDGECVIDIGAFEYQPEVGVESGPKQVSIPDEFYLSQNHPNPFNSVTQIKCALAKDCYVKLEVYNILGQRVAILVDSRQKAGCKLAKWDAGSLPSGIYFYRLKAGEFSRTKKMILIK